MGLYEYKEQDREKPKLQIRNLEEHHRPATWQDVTVKEMRKYYRD